VDAGTFDFQAIQALDRAQERRAFEQFIDVVHERLTRWPDLHVYHYAAYEVTALKRLMSEYSTREEALDELLRARAGADYESRICVDTAPLLERSYARLAGLGWIGRNTCLINQAQGSWFFLGELLVSLEIAPDAPPPDRCGTCMRCVAACPTAAIVPGQGLDATLCISYFTIELRGAIPEENRAAMGAHVFGCDICQDVCPWNGRAPVTDDPAFAPRRFPPRLEELAAIGEEEFRAMFRGTPLLRARYSGFLRNVAVAMGNARQEKFRAPLERLAASEDAVVAGHARWALAEELL